MPRPRTPASWRRILAAAALALAVGAATVRAALDPQDARPLPWTSRDGIVFFLDVVSFPGDSLGGRTEFLVRIPRGALTFDDTLGRVAEGSTRLKLKNSRGKKVHEVKRPFRIDLQAAGAEEFEYGHVVLLEARLAPGWYEAEVKLEDLHTQKVGLAYVGREVHEDGEVQGIFRVPDFSRDAHPVSELEAAWSIAPAEGRLSPFVRGAVEVLPNPSRTYGLFQTQATFYYEFAGSSAERPLFATARVVGADGSTLLEAEPAPLLVQGRSFSQARFDVSPLPAGGYDLVVHVTGEDRPEIERRVHFNVAWRQLTWRGNPHERVDEVHFLLDDKDQEERFTELPPGEQEAFLDAFWKERDPDPATPENEERERFYQRVFEANRQFTIPGIEKGMFSDRGRIYIRYGPPEEIRREVMPTHGLQVDDIAREIAETEGSEYAAPLKGRGNIGGDIRSFEIWTYDRYLSPSTEESRDVGPRAPLRRMFIFVDEEGYGSFVLRYSND